VTWVTTAASSAVEVSRSGPTVPVAPASESV
jgi:hypothetical protein